MMTEEDKWEYDLQMEEDRQERINQERQQQNTEEEQS
jgi:hypothetical protein|tara:strand:+ start:790 stop:900 length:111 start_codon:yes stop_codon:yes gene_type:complete